jgi:2-haloalkanoic acid dehalogenase type II
MAATDHLPVSRPRIVTFDVLGTLLDWRDGMASAVRAAGRPMSPGDFDRVVDRQAALELEEPFRTYREIAARSLAEELRLAPEVADAIAANVGTWPPFPDSAPALRRLLDVVPCVAMTNSDRVHGEQAEARLGLRMSAWICSEEVQVYKPAPRFWQAVSRRLQVTPGPDWWHVSAYADYDGDVAGALGLTTVFVQRPHARPGPAALVVRDLSELADLLVA